MNHLNFDERKLISSMLADGIKCNAIARLLHKDQRAISREIKRNRKISKAAKFGNKILCKKLDKFPFVCGTCKNKYTSCVLTQMSYDAKHAQFLADFRLRNSRTGINATPEELNEAVQIIQKGLSKKESLYSILKRNKIDLALSTVYRYIDEKKIAISKFDLPYAVKYKKRKKKIKEYDYSNTKIDRSNRTYLDYLVHLKHNLNEMTVQMDFLGSIKTDTKSILVLVIPNLQFPILFLIDKKDSKKVVDVFNELERRLNSDKFSDIFPCILTDRDPSFSDFIGIEFSPITGERRTFIFYCDAFKSNQKANVENINKQLRKYFPKGSSVDKYTQKDITRINLFILEQRLASLDGYSPKQAFINMHGESVFNRLFDIFDFPF